MKLKVKKFDFLKKMVESLTGTFTGTSFLSTMSQFDHKLNITIELT